MARIVCFGEILLRLASSSGQLLLQDNRLEATFCGAEANVGIALAGFGHDCAMTSVLPDNALGAAATAELRRHGMDVSALTTARGRMGLYFLSPGAMARASRVTYDRQGSAFALCESGQFDWPTLLQRADVLFVSGITPALGTGPDKALSDAIMTARDAGVKVAFDSNFRPALWQGREAEAAARLRELAGLSDVVFAGRRAIGLMLGRTFNHPDGDTAFAEATEAMFDAAQNIRHIAATRRSIISSDHHQLTALLAARDGVSRSRTVDLHQIVDRVGTGDAFAAGIVHGLSQRLPGNEIVEFAIACSQWAHSINGDFLRASLTDIGNLMTGAGDVSR